MQQEPTHGIPGGIRSLVGSRGRIILQTGAWSAIAKACGAANLFISVPFVLAALGTERFGVWATLCAFTAFTGFLDFGFGNGAMNMIASARGRNALHEIPLIFSAATRALTSTTACLFLTLLPVWWLAPWHHLLHLPPAFAAECRIAVGCVIASILAAVPLGLSTRMQLGLGRGERAYRWQALANLITLGTVIGLARLHASLPLLTAATVAGPLLGPLVNTLQLRRESNGIRAHLGGTHSQIIKQLRRSGFQFFILQISAVLAFSTDLPLITGVLGPEQAAPFAIVQRLFSIIPMGLALLWIPLWPLYRNALAAGDIAWTVRTFRLSLLAATGTALVLGSTLVFGFEPLSRIWIGHAVPASLLLLLGFALWCVLDAAGGAIATFLNAAGILRPQLVIALVFAAACLPLKYWAITRFGATAIIWVTACLCLLINLLPLWLLRHRLASKVHGGNH